MRYICGVKLLSTILAFLVFVLSVQPVCIAAPASNTCCSTNYCSDEAAGDDECSGDDADDNGCSGCNPFQLCGCCAFCVVIPSSVSLLFIPPSTIAKVKWGCRTTGLVAVPVGDFWKPPRIS